MEMGTTYYVLGVTTGMRLSQHTQTFPIIDGDRDDRILAGTTALQVFADHKRAWEYLEDEIPTKTNKVEAATGEEVTDFRISHMRRHEVKALASDLDADYILIEQADGRYTVVDVER